MSKMEEFYDEYWEHREDIDHLYSQWVPERLETAVELLEQHGATTVLDVGCGEGTLGRLLDDAHETTCVDISERALELAADHYDETEVVNVEDDDLETVVEGDFDAVVCLELLEHVFHPEQVLENVRSVLRPDGALVASFPNSVFWKYRIDVLRGRPPQDYTLYDEAEHLQDFTLDTFARLLQESGFDVRAWHPQFAPPRFVPQSVARRRPSLFADQVVVEATPQ